MELISTDNQEINKLPYIQNHSLNLTKILEKERMELEKKNLLKKSDKSNLLYKSFLKGYVIYEKMSKIYNLRYVGSTIFFDELDASICVPFSIKDITCNDVKTKERLTILIQECIKDIK